MSHKIDQVKLAEAEALIASRNSIDRAKGNKLRDQLYAPYRNMEMKDWPKGH